MCIRDSSYTLLGALLGHKQYAHQAFGSSLFSFLIERGADNSTEGLRLKYDIVAKVVNEPWINDVLNAPMMEAMTKYLSQGAFYSESKLEVATEG